VKKVDALPSKITESSRGFRPLCTSPRPLSLVAFLIACLIATNYTLNHFYVRGGYMQDSGWFAYLMAHATTWPPQNPPAIGGQFFATHFSPGINLLGLSHSFLARLGLPLPETVWFSLTQGLWLGIIASASLSLLQAGQPIKTARQAITLLGLSLAIALNGISMAILSYPHFELAIPALFLGFFALEREGHSRSALLVLFLGLLMREDAGFHYFGFFSLTALAFLFHPSPMNKRRQAKFFGFLALLCLGYSLIAIAIQKGFFADGDNALARVYLGDPPWAHLDRAFLIERLHFFVRHRLYILGPLILLLGLSVFRRSFLLSIGVVAVLPWLSLNLTAIAALPGSLTSHYAFPLIMALFWPLIAHRLSVDQQHAEQPFKGSLLDVSLVCLLSIGCYAADSQGNADDAPWRHFGPEWLGRIEKSHTALKGFLTANSGKSFVVDDAVVAILSSEIRADGWAQLLGFSDGVLQGKDGILFKRGTWQEDLVRTLANRGGFSRPCYLELTEFAVLSRTVELNACHPMRLSLDHALWPGSQEFDLLQGWSGGEAQGRWTLGESVTLPAIEVARPLRLCLKGHGFLPTPRNRVIVEVQLDGKRIEEFLYTPENPGGERCALLTPREPIAKGHYLWPSLKIQGASTPMAWGLSDDRRRLGLFVEEISFKAP
jgi:hypothetical protein